jgi:hypothetical protein
MASNSNEKEPANLLNSSTTSAPQPHHEHHHQTAPVASTVQAGLSRSITAPLAFFFKTPLRLFRPPRVSHTAVLNAVVRAEHNNARLSPQFLRQLIREQPSILSFTVNWILPPLIANAVVGMTLFGAYEFAQSKVKSCDRNPFSELMCGAAGGLAHGAIVHPLESLKSQFIRSRGAAAAGEAQPYSWARVGELCRGVHRTMMRDSFAFGVFFGSYEGIRELIAGRLTVASAHSRKRRLIEAINVVGSGLAASYLTCAVLHQFERPKVSSWLPKATDFARGWLPMAIALFSYHFLDIYDDE